MKKVLAYILIFFISIFSCVNACFASSFEYDSYDRLIRVIYDDGSYIEYTYDSGGNILSVDKYGFTEDGDINAGSNSNVKSDDETEDSSKPGEPNNTTGNGSDGVNAVNSNNNSGSISNNNSDNDINSDVNSDNNNNNNDTGVGDPVSGEYEKDDLQSIPNNSRTLRSEFTPAYKMEFKEWWINQGREWPNGNVNIHHIKPLSKGGTNSFENLVPLIQPKEHQPFTNWWRYYP